MNLIKKELIGEDILKVLPHRYPFLLLDRVTVFLRKGHSS